MSESRSGLQGLSSNSSSPPPWTPGVNLPDNPGSIYTLQVALWNLKEKCKKQQRRIEELEHQNQTLINDKTEIYSEVESLSKNNIRLREKNLFLNQEVHKKATNSSEFKDQLTNLKEQQSQSNKQLNNLLQENTELKKEVAKLTQESFKLSKNLNAVPNKPLNVWGNLPIMGIPKGRQISEVSETSDLPSALPEDSFLPEAEQGTEEKPTFTVGSTSTSLTMDTESGFEEGKTLNEIKKSKQRMNEIKNQLVSQRGLLVEALKRIASSHKADDRFATMDNLNFSEKFRKWSMPEADKDRGMNSVEVRPTQKLPQNVGVESFDVPLDANDDNGENEDDIDRLCPMCEAAFPRNYSQDEFESHVVDHFNYEEADTLKNYEVISDIEQG